MSSQAELVVADAREHPVLRSNLAIAELGVIAYAGVPLAAVAGQPIGSFCAIDTRPRAWTADELVALRSFALLAEAQAALALPLGSAPWVGDRPRHVLAITRAASRGFHGAARLLRRTNPPLTSDQITALAAIVERHSHQLIEVAADRGPGVVSEHLQEALAPSA